MGPSCPHHSPGGLLFPQCGEEALQPWFSGHASPILQILSLQGSSERPSPLGWHILLCVPVLISSLESPDPTPGKQNQNPVQGFWSIWSLMVS